MKGILWGIFFGKKSHNVEKIEGEPFGEFFWGKSLTMSKKLKGGPFSFTRYCLIRGKNFFWFSSLGQQVQFGALKFCRTFGRAVLVTSDVSKKT